MFLVAAEHNQKGIPAYPSTSNVFANDVHRTSSPILNRPLAIPVRNSTAPFSEHINRNSIVLKMTYGGVSFLFMGDAHADAESRMVNSGTNLQEDSLIQLSIPNQSTSKDQRHRSGGPGIPMAIQQQRHWVALPRWDLRCTAPT